MAKREMLINYVPGEECRIAIVEGGRLEELYQERASSESHVGSIYKGRVINVEPSIQAAFIDFGLERNGFLHITDLHPMYFPGDAREETELVGQKTPRHERPPMQRCLRRGQEILVQVLKEGLGTKGPTLTSYLSIPGQFLVMMPHMSRLGVSRKVEDDDARRKMRKLLDELDPPSGFGFIIRTAGIGRTKTDLKRDLSYLVRLWKRINDRMQKTPGVGELYAESDLVIRTIRDVFSTDIERIVVDNEQAARRARDFLAIASPRSGSKVVRYVDPVPLFHRFDIERQIETINARTVPLPSGGSLVIEQTEALVAIDVNSGKSRDARDAETNAFRTNLEAADEICRQLRLRDLGGVVINDLIDMTQRNHRMELERRFRENLARDRARTRIGRISQFGLLEMTRQRMRPSLERSIYIDCPVCQGTGQTKSVESVVLHVMRRLALVMHRKEVARVELTISPDVAFQLLNRKRSQLVGIERQSGKTVMVHVHTGGAVDFVELVSYDGRGGRVEAERIEHLAAPLLEVSEELEEIEQDRKSEDDLEQAEEALAAAEKVEAAREPIRPPMPGSAPAEKSAVTSAVAENEPTGKRRRRRRRRGGRSRENEPMPQQHGEKPQPAPKTAAPPPAPRPNNAPSPSNAQNVKPQGQPAPAQSSGHSGRKRRKRRSKSGNQPMPQNAAPAAPTVHSNPLPSRGYSNKVIPVGAKVPGETRKES